MAIRSARVYGFARIVMFGPVSKVVLCPVSMSDGAARGMFPYTKAGRDLIELCSSGTLWY